MANLTDSSTLTAPGVRDLDVAGLTSNSRAVEDGFLFAALPGSERDGRDFIGDAVARGASVVLAPAGTRLPEGLDPARVFLVTDNNPRQRLARLAARFYGDQPATAVAVTGTNGKTSTVEFTRQIWAHLGATAASMGTLGVTAPGFAPGPSLTTPEQVELHRTLATLAKAGISHVALEASSHGLDQFRLDGVRLRAAAFTSFGRDHLDYHGTEDAYLAAKLRLFTALVPAGGCAVLNADMARYRDIATACLDAQLDVCSYGRAGDDLRIDDLAPLADGQRLCLALNGRTYDLKLPLIGAFQASNALAALGLVLAAGGDRDKAVAAVSRLTGVPGRLQLAGRRGNGAAVYVDYAHTPDALEAVLTTVRPHVRGRLWVVFGAGGDRDAGKRPLMGAAAARLADQVIVTDDNPRSEDAARIREDIMVGCPEARAIAGRDTAIDAGVTALADGDALVIAGKGHETGQIVGDAVLPFDDVAVARAAIAAIDAPTEGDE